MKKIICTILICLMFGSCFALVGCGDKKGNVKNFYSSYTNIASTTTNLTLVEATDIYQIKTNSYKIDINYSKSSILSTLVENNSQPYHKLKYFYQQLLDDTLSPLYFFGEEISNSSNISNKQATKLTKDLTNLEQEYKDIDHYVGILINSLNANNNSSDFTNLTNLKKVFVQYEQSINKATDLSNTICKVYFGTVVSNPNYNYSTKTYTQLNEADLTRMSVDVRARMYYYKSVYANVYNQLYVKDGNLSEQFVSYNASAPTYEPYTSLKGIINLTSKSMENLLNNKQNIYNAALTLYNLQNSFGNAYDNFITASNNISYTKLDSSSSINDLNYGTIITQFSNGIAYDSCEILLNLTTLLYL